MRLVPRIGETPRLFRLRDIGAWFALCVRRAGGGCRGFDRTFLVKFRQNGGQQTRAAKLGYLGIDVRVADDLVVIRHRFRAECLRRFQHFHTAAGLIYLLLVLAEEPPRTNSGDRQKYQQPRAGAKRAPVAQEPRGSRAIV
jgi:hypothetical protein